jgi:hypothetical protein
MTQWDYAVYVIDDVNDIFREQLQNLGNDGWELVSVVSGAMAGGKPRLVVFLKRPRR